MMILDSGLLFVATLYVRLHRLICWISFIFHVMYATYTRTLMGPAAPLTSSRSRNTSARQLKTKTVANSIIFAGRRKRTQVVYRCFNRRKQTE